MTLENRAELAVDHLCMALAKPCSPSEGEGEREEGGMDEFSTIDLSTIGKNATIFDVMASINRANAL